MFIVAVYSFKVLVGLNYGDGTSVTSTSPSESLAVMIGTLLFRLPILSFSTLSSTASKFLLGMPLLEKFESSFLLVHFRAKYAAAKSIIKSNILTINYSCRPWGFGVLGFWGFAEFYANVTF